MKQLMKILERLNSAIDFETETELIDGGKIDSMELMELVTELEDIYGISIDMEEICPENFNSAEAIMNMIERLK